MAKKSEDTLDFETALKDLEALVEKMESGDLSLEQSLEEYERGMKLSEECQKVLQEAELRVKTITAKYSAKTSDNDDDND